MVEADTIDKFVAWAKRRGLIWPSSEVYGGLGSSYDYGPVGVEMKNRLKQQWWRQIVTNSDDIVGLDTAIILNPDVWKASGHLERFTDPLVEDVVTHKRYRLDDLANPKLSPDGNKVSEPVAFNTMFKTFVGPVEETASTAYLRPETCQGIFINFKQTMEVSRMRPPFGIGQIGKAFRNEITPGNLTFRTREFEQMELEYFVEPGTDDEWFDKWVQRAMDFVLGLGIDKSRLRLYKHPKKDLSHYSKATTDIEYLYPWGWGELMGIANRTDYDLKQHQEATGKDMTYFDEKTKQKYLPYVIEPSMGVDRLLLAVLLDAWSVYEKGRKENGEEETVLAVTKLLSAYDCAVFPLVKKEPLINLAKELTESLRARGQNVFYDESGSIGRRYRRQDEIGTPVCYTVDFDSLEDKQVTARDRDKMSQERIEISKLS